MADRLIVHFFAWKICKMSGVLSGILPVLEEVAVDKDGDVAYFLSPDFV